MHSFCKSIFLKDANFLEDEKLQFFLHLVLHELFSKFVYIFI